jgi:hypothetical protein
MLQVPVLISEHCPASLGPMVTELRELCAPSAIVTTTHFSCADERACAKGLPTSASRQVVLA